MSIQFFSSFLKLLRLGLTSYDGRPEAISFAALHTNIAFYFKLISKREIKEKCPYFFMNRKKQLGPKFCSRSTSFALKQLISKEKIKIFSLHD